MKGRGLLQSWARALGGEVCGGQVLAPGPGHLAKDRSLCVKLDPAAPATTVLADLRKRLSVIQDAYVPTTPPPPVQGIGNAGGFKMMLQDRAGLGSDALARAAQTLVGAANKDPSSAGVFTLFGTRAPLKARNTSGEMVPIGTVARLKYENAPYRVPRYNLFPAAEVMGVAAPGVATGTALHRMGLPVRLCRPASASNGLNLPSSNSNQARHLCSSSARQHYSSSWCLRLSMRTGNYRSRS
jgi:multidrug efflux pump subunit AcrB